MKTIGLIGGMSWESTVPYYARINELFKDRLGGLSSARIVLVSVNFAEVAALQRAGDWAAAARLLADAARALERAGADVMLICTNTMHLVAAEVAAAVSIPLLHIADATAQPILAAGQRRVGLLGTRFTMEHDFYRTHMREHHGIEVLVPDEADRALVHQVIFDELCVGVRNPHSREAYRRIMQSLAAQGVEGIILGCTEISLLVQPDDAPLPLYDSTVLHADAAAQWVLQRLPQPVAS